MRPTERLGLLALLSLSLLLAAFHPPGAARGLVLLAITAAGAVVVRRLAPARGLPAISRDAAPYAVMVVVFTLLQPAIEALRAARYDTLFADLDQRWLGGLVAAWRGALGRPAAFTDAVYVAYVSFYLLPVVVLLSIRRWEGPEVMERASFVVLLGFYLSFVGYFLWPTAGPRLPIGQEASLGGGAVSRAVRTFLHGAEGTTLDAFPSGHTAMSLLTAHVGIRHLRGAAAPIAAWAAAIVFSTVYIQVHYAVDVAAGVLLYLVTLAVVRTARLRRAEVGLGQPGGQG